MVAYKSVLLRIAGIVFFMLSLSVSLPVLARTAESYAFLISEPQTGWGLFYVFTSFLLLTFFFMSLFSCGTAAIFAGSGGYTQSVWNCGINALVCVSLFVMLQTFTGITEDDLFIMNLSEVSIFLLILYNVVVFFTLKGEKDFYWKNLFFQDNASKLCLKVYVIMIFVSEIACFLYAHKIIEV